MTSLRPPFFCELLEENAEEDWLLVDAQIFVPKQLHGTETAGKESVPRSSQPSLFECLTWSDSREPELATKSTPPSPFPASVYNDREENLENQNSTTEMRFAFGNIKGFKEKKTLQAKVVPEEDAIALKTASVSAASVVPQPPIKKKLATKFAPPKVTIPVPPEPAVKEEAGAGTGTGTGTGTGAGTCAGTGAEVEAVVEVTKSAAQVDAEKIIKLAKLAAAKCKMPLLCEWRAMKRPPAACDCVVDALLILIEGETKDFSLKRKQAMFKSTDFFKKCADFDAVNNISKKQIRKLSPLFADPNFNEESQKKRSLLMVYMYHWVFNVVKGNRMFHGEEMLVSCVRAEEEVPVPAPIPVPVPTAPTPRSTEANNEAKKSALKKAQEVKKSMLHDPTLTDSRDMADTKFWKVFAKPCMHNYGRMNTDPCFGGCVWGGYMLTNNVNPQTLPNYPATKQVTRSAEFKYNAVALSGEETGLFSNRDVVSIPFNPLFNPTIIEDNDIATSRGKTDKTVVKRKVVDMKKDVEKKAFEKVQNLLAEKKKRVPPPKPKPKPKSKSKSKSESNPVVAEPTVASYLAPSVPPSPKKNKTKISTSLSTKTNTKASVTVQTPALSKEEQNNIFVITTEAKLRNKIEELFNNDPKRMRNVGSEMMAALVPAGVQSFHNATAAQCILMI